MSPTYHVIRDQLQMPAIDIDFVYVEDASDFTKDGGTSSLNTVRAEDGVDVI